MQVGALFLPCSVTVLEGDSDVEFLFGLDMLKKHQCVIDLGANSLRIGTEVLPFLAEKDIPNRDRAPVAVEETGPSTTGTVALVLGFN